MGVLLGINVVTMPFELSCTEAIWNWSMLLKLVGHEASPEGAGAGAWPEAGSAKAMAMSMIAAIATNLVAIVTSVYVQLFSNLVVHRGEHGPCQVYL